MLTIHTWALVMGMSEPGVELEWRAPVGCASEGEVIAEVEQLLAGRRPPEVVEVRAEVVAEGPGFTAMVAIGGAAPRMLRAGECAALGRAVAVVIAVAVDPSGSREGGVPEAGVVPAPPDRVGPVGVAGPVEPDGVAVDPVVEPVAVDPVVVSEPVRARPRVVHGLGVRGGLLVGATDFPTGAVGVVYGLERGLLRVEARALYATPRRITYDKTFDGAGVRVQAVTFAALACVAPGSATLRVPLCLGAEAGPLIGRGIGVPNGLLRADLWASGLFGVGVVGRAHRRFNLMLGLEIAVALRRPAFHVADYDPVRSRAVGARLLVGFEFPFGR